MFLSLSRLPCSPLPSLFRRFYRYDISTLVKLRSQTGQEEAREKGWTHWSQRGMWVDKGGKQCVPSDGCSSQSNLLAVKKLEEYSHWAFVGQGGVAKVYAVLHTPTMQKRAIKVMSKTLVGKHSAAGRRLDSQIPKLAASELNALLALSHRNVVKLYEWFETDENWYLVCELLEGGELLERFTEITKDSASSEGTEEVAAGCIKQINAALAYAHAQGVTHRDLKLRNIMFATRAINSPVKIIDFGLSAVSSSPAAQTGKRCGTITFMAPELLSKGSSSPFEADEKKGLPLGAGADVWALGVMSFILLTGEHPLVSMSEFNHLSYREKSRMLAERMEKGQIRRDLLEGTSLEAQSYILSLLQPPSSRPSASEASNHPWFMFSADSLESVPDFHFSPPSSLDEVVKTDTKRPPKEVMNRVLKYAKLTKFERAVLTVMAYHRSDGDMRRLRAVFKQLDTEKRGVLSAEQLEEGMQRAGISIDSELMKDAFEKMNSSGSHEINYTEFLAATIDPSVCLREDKFSVVKAAFDFFDTERVGYIRLSEVSSVLGLEISEEDLLDIRSTAGRNVKPLYAVPSSLGANLPEDALTFDDFCTLVAKTAFKNSEGEGGEKEKEDGVKAGAI